MLRKLLLLIFGLIAAIMFVLKAVIAVIGVVLVIAAWLI